MSDLYPTELKIICTAKVEGNSGRYSYSFTNPEHMNRIPTSTCMCEPGVVTSIYGASRSLFVRYVILTE